MATWVDRCATEWIDASLSAVLVTGFTALAMIQCRQPVRRRAWGRIGLAASFLVIPLSWLGPLPRIDIRHPSFSTRTVELRSDATRRISSTSAVSQRETTVPGSAGGWANSAPRSTWITILWQGSLFLYVGGFAVGWFRLLLGLLGTALLIQRGQKPSARTEELLTTLVHATGNSRRPRILVSVRTGRPVLVGFLQPTILIPPELDQPNSEAKLRLGLLHELAHDEVDDYRFGVLSAAAQAVWFFLPQVWWIRSQLRLDAEFLADHRAVSHYGTSYHYAESLVGLAMIPTALDSHPQPATDRVDRIAPSAGLVREGFASALFQRVQMLLKCPFEVEGEAPRRWVIAASLCMSFWTLVASALSIQQSREQSNEVSWRSVDEAIYALRLAELSIAPQLLENRLFDLRFRLPHQFRLACEVLAEPAELPQMEIMGYRLSAPRIAPPPRPEPSHSGWRRIVIVRDAAGMEAIHVDGKLAVARHYPAQPASWLTVRPLPGRTTRFRNLELTW